MRLCKPCLYGIAPLVLSFPLTTTAAESDPSFMLEEVIVTAQKRAESLQDTPISITAFNEDALTQQGISSVDDLQGKVPSLNMTPFPTQNTSLRLFIRGVGASDIQVTQDPAVGVYIDQVYIGRSTGLALELADLAQIEVLRGPQGTLFGRNSIGGAINMTTITPQTGEFSFKQELGAGNRNLFRSKTSANIPITDTLALRAVVLFREKDGYVENGGPGSDFFDSEDKGAKLDFLWEPNEDWSLRYTYDYARSEFVSPTFQATEAGPLSELLEIPVSSKPLRKLSTKDPMLPAETDIDGHALTISREWDTVTLKSITAYREFKYSEYTDLESGSASPLLYLNTSGGIDLTGHPPILDQDQLSQEFQLLGDPGETISYVLGLYYFDENATQEGGSRSAVLAPQPDQVNLFDIENTAWAVYAQSDWTPNILDSRFTLTTGIRYTEDDRVAARSYTLDPDPDSISFAGKPKSDFENISYTVVANFAATDDINTYLKLATGYKSGGYNVRASNEASYLSGFDEEEITSWELGIKSELLDRRLRLNGAIYFSDYTDIQLNLADNSTPADVRDTNVFNAGEGEIAGAELDLTALLTEGLTASLAYAYQDADFTKVVAPDEPEISEKDFVFSNAPEHQYTLALNYFYPMSFGDLNASLNYNWVDDRFDTQKAEEALSGVSVIDDYGLLGGYLGLSNIKLGSAGDLTISIWGKNLLDEEYFTAAPVVLQPAGAYNKAVIWGEPNSYGVDLIYNFSK
ncbi:MAG: TonB-dependent receptor [Halioglobus sp.]